MATRKIVRKVKAVEADNSKRIHEWNEDDSTAYASINKFYLTYDNVNYYFDKPNNIAIGGTFDFNISSKVLKYEGTTITTSTTGDAVTELNFVPGHKWSDNFVNIGANAENVIWSEENNTLITVKDIAENKNNKVDNLTANLDADKYPTARETYSKLDLINGMVAAIPAGTKSLWQQNPYDWEINLYPVASGYTEGETYSTWHLTSTHDLTIKYGYSYLISLKKDLSGSSYSFRAYEADKNSNIKTIITGTGNISNGSEFTYQVVDFANLNPESISNAEIDYCFDN